MIISKYVQVKPNGRCIKRYVELGYLIKVNETINIEVNDLPKSSHIRIDVMCDICGIIKNTPYRSYILSVERGGFYACSQKCSHTKVKETTLELYGVGMPSVVDKRRKTTNERYGVDNAYKLKEFQEKAKKTKLNLYGDEYYSNSEKHKETILTKYGVKNISEIEFVKEQRKKTCMKNYGVENPLQNIDIHRKQLVNSGKLKHYKNYTYRSTYELDFIKLCESLNISLCQDIVVKYFFNDKHRRYYPDFYIKEFNLLCEIKSSWTYNSSLEQNLVKEQSCLSNNYNYIFIIDKNYDEFIEKIKTYNL